MKKFLHVVLLFVSVVAVSFASFADDIKLRNVDGFYKVPVQLNGVITLDFALDTGAADVSMSDEVVDALVKSGAINSADIRGSRIYTMADGSDVKCRTLIIRSIRMGSQVAMDVDGSTCPGKALLLLGQSFLRKIGKWSLDFENNILEVKGSVGKVAMVTPAPPPAVKPPEPARPSEPGKTTEPVRPQEPVKPAEKKAPRVALPPAGGEACDFDMNQILNGPSRKEADSEWSCKMRKYPMPKMQLFADGTGKIHGGKIIWRKTGCRSFEYDYTMFWMRRNLETWAAADLYGDVNYGTMTMTLAPLEGRMGTHNVVCVKQDIKR